MKKSIRAALLKDRDSILPEQKFQKNAEIRNRLFALDEFMRATSILLYASFRSEVNTSRWLDDVLTLGKKLILPVVDPIHKILHLYEVKDTTEISPGHMGIPEPKVVEGRRRTLRDIDLVIIPGAGFDIEGNRLGYGGGYYDKLMSHESRQREKAAHHIPVIALAFEEQIADKIPAEPHDIKVDVIITDKRLIRCNYQ